MSSSHYPFDLGPHQFLRDATADYDAETQAWLNRGANWMFGFNHEEAVTCFKQAADAEENCALAHWGIAYCVGPNYNKIWDMFPYQEKQACLKTAWSAIEKGKAVASEGSLEMQLLLALETRYPQSVDIEDYAPFTEDFAKAMTKLFEDNRSTLDIVCLYVESIMGRTPWALWDLTTGDAAEGASTLIAKTVLERTFEDDLEAWRHPGLLHFYIHLLEMSPTPELALPHGDALANLVPASGHLLHMATHIDVLCGDYHNVVERNRRAANADQPFTALRGADNFYTVYRIHNVHFIAYGAMFLAQKRVALEAAEELRELLPEPIVAFMPDFFEAFWGMKLHVMVRFGMWDEILQEPLPENTELFSFTHALQRYARTIAFANTDEHELATQEYEAFAAAKLAVQETRFMFNNPAAEVLNIAEQMALGERFYKSGEVEQGFEHLRQAAYLSDNLLYDEPWGWMQPPRHALAALLMDQERYAQAEEIYRSDLGLTNTLFRPCQHPGNVWSLHGLHECLVKRGEQHEVVHVKNQLDQAVARAEVPIRASCYCRKSAA